MLGLIRARLSLRAADATPGETAGVDLSTPHAGAPVTPGDGPPALPGDDAPIIPSDDASKTPTC